MCRSSSVEGSRDRVHGVPALCERVSRANPSSHHLLVFAYPGKIGHLLALHQTRQPSGKVKACRKKFEVRIARCGMSLVLQNQSISMTSRIVDSEGNLRI